MIAIVSDLVALLIGLWGMLQGTVSDEEDVVIRAFCAFLRRTESGAYAELSTRDDLWRLLATITKTQAWKQSRFLQRFKRKPPRSVRNPNDVLSGLASGVASPDVLASVSDTLSRLLSRLEAEDPELKAIAMGRLEGSSNQELADRLNRSVRTIERRLNVIRAIWEQHF